MMASALTTLGCGNAGFAARVGAGDTAAVAAAGAAFAPPLTSSLRMRPPRPLPFTSVAAMPFSSIDLARCRHRSRWGVAACANKQPAAAGFAAAGAAAAPFGVRIKVGNDFTGDYGFTVAFDDLDDHAGAGCGQFKDHLVRFRYRSGSDRARRHHLP